MKHHVVYELHTAISRDQGRIREKTRLDYKAAAAAATAAAVAAQHSSLWSSNEASSSTTNHMKDAVRYVRLTIHKPSEHWGSSIWRLQLWGTAVDMVENGNINNTPLAPPPN